MLIQAKKFVGYSLITIGALFVIISLISKFINPLTTSITSEFLLLDIIGEILMLVWLIGTFILLVNWSQEEQTSIFHDLINIVSFISMTIVIMFLPENKDSALPIYLFISTSVFMFTWVSVSLIDLLINIVLKIKPFISRVIAKRDTLD